MSHAASSPSSKDDFRSTSLQRRNELPTRLRHEYSLIIATRIRDLEVFCEAQTVAGYWSFGSEVNTEALLRATLEEKTLLLPKIDKSSGTLGLLKVTTLDSDEDLQHGVWGIREPNPFKCEPCALDLIDLILVPGVAFDRHGGRIGYGKGFYDRLLSTCQAAERRPMIIAAAFECQVWDRVPRDSHDVPVEILITEAGVWYRKP